MLTVAYINFWKDVYNDSYLTKFIEKNIGPVEVVHHTRNNLDILIASCMGNINTIQQINARCKIFYYGENLNRYPPYNNDELLYNTFDLIVGFKETDPPKKQIRFPLWLFYYKYYNCKSEDTILSYIQCKYNENSKKHKDLFGSILCRHDHGGQRTILYNELSKYGKISSPGIFKNNMPPIGKTHNDKISFISRGLYNICPENSKFDGYFTEKIFQAFEGGTIPLYWAIGNPETNIINKNKYCFCTISNKTELDKEIKHVIEHPNHYLEGDLFTPNAIQHIELFYTTLEEGIRTKLSQSLSPKCE
jgi:alpha(1,3/1,4) fucosyltransferase